MKLVCEIKMKKNKDENIKRHDCKEYGIIQKLKFLLFIKLEDIFTEYVWNNPNISILL